MIHNHSAALPPDAASSPDDDGLHGAPSKTQRKKNMYDLQKLGEALTQYPRESWATLDLPERLQDALTETAHIKKHEARRRHLQYVGKLMRDVDPEPIRAWLKAQQTMPAQEKAYFARLEQWRTRLLADPQALDELHVQFPSINRAAWQKQIAAACHERQNGLAPHHFRALFHDLKNIFATT